MPKASAHRHCRMFDKMRPDIIEAGLRMAARVNAQFVCKDCGKPFATERGEAGR